MREVRVREGGKWEREGEIVGWKNIRRGGKEEMEDEV